MQLFFSLQWCRKPLSSLWQYRSLVCLKHSLESAGCSHSYGQKSLALKRLCWMPTGGSTWAPAGIQRGMALYKCKYSSPPFLLGSCWEWIGKEIKFALLHSELKCKVRYLSIPVFLGSYCWTSALGLLQHLCVGNLCSKIPCETLWKEKWRIILN